MNSTPNSQPTPPPVNVSTSIATRETAPTTTRTPAAVSPGAVLPDRAGCGAGPLAREATDCRADSSGGSVGETGGGGDAGSWARAVGSVARPAGTACGPLGISTERYGRSSAGV